MKPTVTAANRSNSSEILPVQETKLSSRLGWVDYAKGICILCIVGSHVTGGAVDAGLIVNSSAQKFYAAFVYSFQIPVFFFLAGLFLDRSLRKPAAQFLQEKVKTLMYPYLLWSLIQVGISANISSLTNIPRDFWSVAGQILIFPYAQFWFFYALFGAQLIFWGLSRLGSKAYWIFAIALGFYCTLPWLERLSWAVPGQVARYLPYLVLGSWLSLPVRAWIEKQSAPKLFVFALITLGSLGVIVTSVSYRWLWAGLPLGILGTLGIVALSAWLERKNFLTVLRYIGSRSLQIYVAHVLCTAGARILLIKLLHVHSVPIHLFVGMGAGVILPLALDKLSQRFRFTWLFTPKFIHQ